MFDIPAPHAGLVCVLISSTIVLSLVVRALHALL
jgi:hypothetical protein